MMADTFHDPFLLNGMQRAVETVNLAIRKQRFITVYGDYDCDGTCACAILYSAFKKAGTPIDVYIPDRRTQGYGLNADAIRAIAKNGGLLITVDCGITNIQEVELARSLGLTVLVTDHHKPLDTLPDCVCVNPAMGENYPCAHLCGAGTALKLVHALWGEEAMRSLLDFAAIATVADLVPLLGENRAIVKAGLDKIMENERPGIMALIKACGYGNKKLTAGQIAFGIGPRINAAGRMGHAKRAFSLFTTDDVAEAELLAQELDRENQLRQRQEQQMLKTACDLLGNDIYFKRTAVVAQTGWHPGVIGIVASRLVEIYGRPSVVIAINEDGMCSGSARGIMGVNIFAALNDCSAYFTRYGGHEQAGGFSLPAENLPGFIQAYENHFQTQYPSALWAKSIECDLSVQPEHITLALAKDLAQLAPFGIGNPKPKLLMAQTKLMGKVNLGRTADHLRIALEKNGNRAEGLLFRAKQYDVPMTASVCDFVGTLEEDSFGGVVRARYMICAMRLNKSSIAQLTRRAGGSFGYGFAKCCTRLGTALSFEEADEHVKINPYGLRLNVHVPQTLEDALNHWPDDESMALLEPYLVSMQDAVHGRNALVIAPDAVDDTRYPLIYRLDSDKRIQAYAQTVFLDRDVMAKVYRHLRKTAKRPMEVNERCATIANALGILPDCVGAAIAVFEDLLFLSAETMVLDIHNMTEKKELSSSKLFCALKHMSRGSGNGAKRRNIHV